MRSARAFETTRRRVLALASAAAFIEAMLFSLLSPLLPRFERDLELSATGAGILVASYAIGAFIAAFPSIALARRAGVKATVVTGFLVLAAATFGLGIAGTVHEVTAARFVQGAGSALALTGAIAWLTDVTDLRLRGEAIGTAFSAAFIGAVLGPAFGAAAAGIGVVWVFTTAAACAAALALLALRLQAPSRGRIEGAPPLTQLFNDTTNRVGIWLILVAGMHLGVIGVLVPLQLDSYGLTAVAIGAVFAAAAVIQALASRSLGRFADTHGRELPIRIALWVATGSLLVLTVDDWVWIYVPVAVTSTVALGMVWTPAMALLADAAERRGFDQSAAAGLMNVAWAPGFAIGGVVAGILASTVGDTLPYLLMSGVCLGTLALMRSLRMP